MNNLILSTHLFACLYMTGIILLTQLIHYPAFKFIEDSAFENFHNRHTATMGALVGPVMILELLTAIYLLYSLKSTPWALNLIAVLAIWALTFFLSMPIHHQLSRGKNLIHIKKLILANWPRTILWTLRSAGLLVVYYE